MSTEHNFEQTKALLIALSTAPSYADYIKVAVKVEQGINTERLNGRPLEAAMLKAQWIEIARAILPDLKAKALDPNRYPSLAELASGAKPVTVDDAANLLCAVIEARNDAPYGVAAE